MPRLARSTRLPPVARASRSAWRAALIKSSSSHADSRCGTAVAVATEAVTTAAGASLAAGICSSSIALANLLGDVERARAVGGGQHERKLVAVIAGHQVARPADDVGERAADLLQHVVAGLAAELAVVGAEVIDVDEDQRQRQAVAPGAAPFALEKLEKLFVVGDRGQRILGAEALQLDARGFELGGPGLERALELRGLRTPAAAG